MKERTGEVLTHVDEKWTDLKEVLVETAEHTVRYQPKLYI